MILNTSTRSARLRRSSSDHNPSSLRQSLYGSPLSSLNRRVNLCWTLSIVLYVGSNNGLIHFQQGCWISWDNCPLQKTEHPVCFSILLSTVHWKFQVVCNHNSEVLFFFSTIHLIRILWVWVTEVTFGTAWAGCDPAQSLCCTKCNSSPINGQCINFMLFDVAL